MENRRRWTSEWAETKFGPYTDTSDVKAMCFDKDESHRFHDNTMCCSGGKTVCAKHAAEALCESGEAFKPSVIAESYCYKSFSTEAERNTIACAGGHKGSHDENGDGSPDFYYCSFSGMTSQESCFEKFASEG